MTGAERTRGGSAAGHAPMRLKTTSGRWLVAGSVLGSGAVFLEGSVVSVALPAIARDFRLGVEGLQWVMNGYLLTLSALMLLGGTLGDRPRRSRLFAIGFVPFALGAAWITLRHTRAGETPSPSVSHRSDGVDYVGALLVTLGLGGVVGALIAGPDAGVPRPWVLGTGLGGVALLLAFLAQE